MCKLSRESLSRLSLDGPALEESGSQFRIEHAFLSQSAPKERRRRRAERQLSVKGLKKHINFFNIKFLAPPKTPSFGPPEKSLCASFPGKERQKGTHINFFGEIIGVKNGVPNGPFSTTKMFSLVFFPALRNLPLSRSKMLSVRNLLKNWLLHAAEPYLQVSEKDSPASLSYVC